MKMRKWILATLLAVICLAGVAAVATSAASAEELASGTCGDNLTWVLTDDGVLTISGTGWMYDYSEDDTAPWFAKRTKITSVLIEDGVTSIGEYAFYACLKMTDISIADSVTGIASYAFQDCTKLQSVAIPEGVTSIGSSAFSGCSSLKGVTVPVSITRIYYDAFYDCSSLTSVYITDVAAWCGIDFYSLESNPLYNGADLYLNGELVTGLVVPDGATSIGNYAFYGCSSLTSITIPDGITSIGDWAFSGCSSLTSITISEGVTSIGYSAFYDCRSITSVYITDVVAWCDIEFEYFLSNPLYNGADLYLNGALVTDLVVPEGVISIGNYAFYGYSGLASITIPEGVTSIGNSAFSGCTGLTSVTIPESVISIGESAFSGCTGLTSVTISEGVTSIGDYAFRYCSSLTSITIPESVNSIGYKAFENCSSLWHVLYKGTEADWNEIAFGNSNGDLTSAIRHYNCTGGEVTTSITIAPTCTSDGICVHTCSLCDGSEGGSLPAIGHDYEAVVTEPTCEEDGFTTYACATCGDSYVDNFVEAKGHNYLNGECTECGAPEYVLGDVNNDGKIDTTDAKLIMQYDLGLIGEDAINLAAMDVNGDGKVDTTDAKLIMQLDLGLITEFP